MSWNYRVGKKRYKDFDPKVHGPEDEYTFGIYETYYNDSGGICFTSADPIDPFGTSYEDLRSSFDMMEEAFDKPLIDLDQINYESPDD